MVRIGSRRFALGLCAAGLTRVRDSVDSVDTHGGHQQQRLREPQCAVVEMRAALGAGNHADQKEEADAGEFAGFGEFVAAQFRVRIEEVAHEAIGAVPQVAGDEG
jgi:molybdenum cofactor biosynthesis enzyme MoaA